MATELLLASVHPATTRLLLALGVLLLFVAALPRPVPPRSWCWP